MAAGNLSFIGILLHEGRCRSPLAPTPAYIYVNGQRERSLQVERLPCREEKIRPRKKSKLFLRFFGGIPISGVRWHEVSLRTAGVLPKNPVSGNPGKSHDAASNQERKSTMSVIGYNAAAVNAAYYLNQNTNALNTSITELSSGSRLANASTDPAGVAVSGNITATIGELGAASQAVQDVVSFAQTTDGYLSTMQQQLQRMGELAQSADNGAFGSADIADYSTEFSDLYSQINTIATSAQFNGTSLFSSATTAPTIAVGVDANGTTATFSLATADTTNLGFTTTLGSALTSTNAGSMVAAVNAALTSLTSQRATVNASISKFNFYVQNIATETTNLQSANSLISDVDVATESTELAKNNILVQASSSMLAQANSSQNSLLGLLNGQG
jgi:flagellin